MLVGIGRPESKDSNIVSDYVLSKFPDHDAVAVEDSIERCKDILERQIFLKLSSVYGAQ